MDPLRSPEKPVVSAAWMTLEKGVRAVPEMKYAVALVALVAGISVALGYTNENMALAAFGAVAAIALMVLLVVFVHVARRKPKDFAGPVRTVVWMVVVAFGVSLFLLLASFFGDWPLQLRPGSAPQAPVSHQSVPKVPPPPGEAQAEAPRKLDAICREPKIQSFCAKEGTLDPDIDDYWDLFDRNNDQFVRALQDAAGGTGRQLIIAYGPAGLGKTSYLRERYGDTDEAHGFRTVASPSTNRRLRIADLRKWACGGGQPGNCREAVLAASDDLTTTTGHVISRLPGDTDSGQRTMQEILSAWDPQSEVLALDSFDEVARDFRAEVGTALSAKIGKNAGTGNIIVFTRPEAVPELLNSFSETQMAHVSKVRLRLPHFKNREEIRLRYQNYTAHLSTNPDVQNPATFEELTKLLSDQPALCEAFRHLVVSGYIIDNAHGGDVALEDMMWNVGNRLVMRAQETHNRPAERPGAAPPDPEVRDYLDAMRAAVKQMRRAQSGRFEIPFEAPDVPYGRHGRVSIRDLLAFSGLAFVEPTNHPQYEFMPAWFTGHYLFATECR